MSVCLDCKKEYSFSELEKEKYKSVDILPSTRCFECRTVQRTAFWMFGKFRKGTSDYSGNSMITMMPENARYPIYTRDEWWSDDWDAMQNGKDYDPNRTLFEQLKELQEKTPRPHQIGQHNTDCDWCDDMWNSKNCYLTRSAVRCENLFYGCRVVDTKDSFDISHSYNMQNSYDCLYSFDSHNLNIAQMCRNCIDSFFLYDCRGCSDCFMCWNLRNKKYCIENVQYSKEEYFGKLKEYDLGSHKGLSTLRDTFHNHIVNDAVHKDNFNVNSAGCIGNFLNDCKQCINTFAFEESEDSVNMLRGLKVKDCIDVVGSWEIELSGNIVACTAGYQLKHSSWSEGRYSEYLDLCYDCENCFACVGLRKKKYCILNKQYTEEEYFTLKSQIIGDMHKNNDYGQFLPWSMSLGPYNFSTAMIYFDHISREEVLQRGGYWQDDPMTQTDGMVATEFLPDTVLEADDKVCTQALLCPKSGHRFNIAAQELVFHKRKNIALPRTHFDVRTLNRMRTISSLIARDAVCCYCDKKVAHYYEKNNNYRKIACTKCYQSEIS